MTSTVTARKISARASFLSTVYGNWCGLGRSGPAAPIDNLDTCCQAHDACHQGNCVKSTINCNCQNAFITCLNAVLTACPRSNTSEKCTYARNAKTYATEVKKTACLGQANLFCLLTG